MNYRLALLLPALGVLHQHLYADVQETALPVVEASISDDPIDGIGDLVSVIPPLSIGLSASVEDRGVLEFDISQVVTFGVSDMNLVVKIVATDTTALGPRNFEFLMYAADGVA
jgi:hypothetical protein